MKFIQLFPILLLALQAIAQNTNENWDTYMAPYEKGSGSVLLNMDLKQKAPVAGYGFLLITGVKVKECAPDGFPAQKEFQTLYKISDDIRELIEKKKREIPAGTFTYQCERTDYYYVNDTVLLRKYLSDFYQTNYPQYSFIITIQEDKNWNRYLNFLYPNTEVMESMLNQKVVLQLLKGGDKLEKERQIDHWLYFKSDGDRAKFVSYAIGLKFKVEHVEKRTHRTGYPYSLQISRTDFPDLPRITQLTLMLRKEAIRYNGEYDGWETFIIKN